MTYFDDKPAIGSGSNTGQLRRLQTPSSVQFSLKPSWGTSRLRDVESTTNGGTIGETGGEIQVSTGTDGDGSAVLGTRERGQYRSGTWAEPSVGVRIPGADNLSGNQDARWGYFDGNNGFGFGVDADGVYTFRQSGGTEMVWREPDWRDGVLAPQHLIDGLVCHVVFRWYGHGPARWYTEPKTNGFADETKIDWRQFREEVSIVDPNLPLRVKVDNGGTAGADLSVFVGGRQFSLWGQRDRRSQQRSTPIVERGYSLGSADTWESVVGLRKKDTFGPSGRPNSVRAVLQDITAVADKVSEVRVNFDAEISGATWSEPEDVAAGETAIERTDGTGFTVSDIGRPSNFITVDRNQGPVTFEEELPLDGTNVLVQVRSGNNITFDIIAAQIREQW